MLMTNEGKRYSTNVLQSIFYKGVELLYLLTRCYITRYNAILLYMFIKLMKMNNAFVGDAFERFFECRPLSHRINSFSA